MVTLRSAGKYRLPAGLTAGLALWVAEARADPAAGDYFVHSLPGAPEGALVKMHAGHIEINSEHNGNLFFWHFQNKHIANKQRTVIWLNGGPGCSSEDGALMEIGPYRLKDDHTLEYNNGSWNEFANVMFVDNPVGTGLSYVNTNSYVHELDEMADQFIIFLKKWFALFPEYEHDDLYFAGESYAGQHIPYIAKQILARNKNAKIKWNLAGLLLGNAWISPPEQYDAYLQYGYERGIVKKGSDIARKLEVRQNECRAILLSKPDGVDHPKCEAILQDMLQYTAIPGSDGKQDCVNMYDVRLTDTYPSCGMNWPPDLKFVTPYLRRRDVLDALHVSDNKNTGWTECNGKVGSHFTATKSVPSIRHLPAILEEVPILLFSGAEDLICNYLGTEALISNMVWNGGKGFELSAGTWAPRRDWNFEGQPAGFWQEVRNLTYVHFLNSSHMVPFDHARRTRDMLDRFMGVDISSIGGTPTDSRLDGEKGPETTVGGVSASNSTQADQEKLDRAKWAAYRKSGEIVLFIVIVATTAWAYFVWRDRRRRKGYKGVFRDEARNGMGARNRGGSGLETFRNKRTNGDVEARDFDESELDDLHVTTPVEGSHYAIGGGSDEEEDSNKTQGHGL